MIARFFSILLLGSAWFASVFTATAETTSATVIEATPAISSAADPVSTETSVNQDPTTTATQLNHRATSPAELQEATTSTGAIADSTSPALASKQPGPEAAPRDKGSSVTLPSGVIYKDLKVGDGPETTGGQTLVLHYTLKLADGKVADSSRTNLLPEPFTFTPGAGEAIPGFEQGVAGMRVGGRRLIEIPPAMGYGEKGTRAIPPGSTLFFDIELLGAK